MGCCREMNIDWLIEIQIQGCIIIRPDKCCKLSCACRFHCPSTRSPHLKKGKMTKNSIRNCITNTNEGMIMITTACTLKEKWNYNNNVCLIIFSNLLFGNNKSSLNYNNYTFTGSHLPHMIWYQIKALFPLWNIGMWTLIQIHIENTKANAKANA